jgi:hypothetical protein
MTDCVDKNPRVTACLFRYYSGECCTGRDYKLTYQRACADLAPVTSHLEGVGNYHAACAAITLVHYTPPPFIALIVPCNFDAVKPFFHKCDASKQTCDTLKRLEKPPDKYKIFVKTPPTRHFYLAI